MSRYAEENRIHSDPTRQEQSRRKGQYGKGKVAAQKPEKKKPTTKPPTPDVMAHMIRMMALKKQGKIFGGANMSPVSRGSTI